LVSGDAASIQVSGGSVNLVVVGQPVIHTVQQVGNSVLFTWSAITNQTYQIQSTVSLAPANWTNSGGTIPVTNSTMTTSEGIGTNSHQFYRVVLVP
jgi:hypothetical protein